MKTIFRDRGCEPSDAQDVCVLSKMKGPQNPAGIWQNEKGLQDAGRMHNG